ncbi:MAG: hypothetical protein GXZ16_06820 [Spirochaetales bacterium]|nr:hypothetical protein [Spirochaetales bacterium]
MMQNIQCYEASPPRRYELTAIALFMPSSAEDTIPPEYPAPSPEGKSPCAEGDIMDSKFLTIRTGLLVRVSEARIIASLVRNPWA